MREDIDDEEKGIDDLEKDADSRLEGVRGRLGSIRGMCSDTTEIESIVARARELHSQAKEAMESGNFREAAGHLERSRKLVKIAGHTAEACDERGLPEVAGMVIQHHGIRTPIAVIKSPKEGETIGRNAVTVRVDAKNIRLEKPSANVVKGEAHFHVFLDDTEQRGPQREFIFRNVTAGEHTIRTELHVADHSLLEGSIADEIKINVTAGQRQSVGQMEEAGLGYFSIDADDKGFYSSGVEIGTVSVAEGEEVEIKFNVLETVYFGGLDFRSDKLNVDTGKIVPGTSTTVKFNASEDFEIASYWPATNDVKARLKVNVK